MSNNGNFGIRLTGVLNVGATVGNINADIKAIEKAVNKIQLKVDIDQKILTTLNNFNKQMLRLKDTAINSGKVIEESLLPDGSKIKRTYFNGLKGEFSELAKGAQESAKANKEQARSLDDIAKGFDKATKAKTAYSASGNVLGSQQTLTNGETDRNIRFNDKGAVTGYTDTTNLQAKYKEEQRLIEQMANFREQSALNARQREEVHNKAQAAAINRNADLERKNAQEYEQFWQKALANRDVKERQVLEVQKQQSKELAQQVNAYKQNKLNELDRFNKQYGGTLDNGQQKQLDSYTKALNNLNAGMPQAEQRMRNLTLGFNNLKNSAKMAAAETGTFGHSLQTAFQKFPIWLITGSIVFAPILALKDMTQRIIEVDTALTNLQRVSGMSDTGLKQFLGESIQLSDQLSNKLMDILTISEEFSRMGFSGNELLDITESAQVLQNISDLSAEDSVKTLTAAMLNYNIAAEDSVRITDLLNEVNISSLPL